MKILPILLILMLISINFADSIKNELTAEKTILNNGMEKVETNKYDKLVNEEKKEIKINKKDFYTTEIIQEAEVIHINHWITEKPTENLTYELTYDGEVFINGQWIDTSTYSYFNYSDTMWIMMDDGYVFDYSDLKDDPVSLDSITINDTKITILFNLDGIKSYPYYLDPTYGNGTIQNCRDYAYDYCNVTVSSTITGEDFELYNTETIIKSGVTIELDYSRLHINSGSKIIIENGATIDGNGNEGTQYNGGNGGSGGPAYYRYSEIAAFAIAGSTNGSNGTSYGGSTGGNGSMVMPFFYTPSAKSSSTADTAGFYTSGALQFSDYVTPAAIYASSGGSGHAILLESYNLSIPGIVSTNGGTGYAASIRAYSAGSAGGEIILRGKYINITGTIRSNGGAGATPGTYEAASGGDGGKIQICAVTSNYTTGSTITVTGGAAAGSPSISGNAGTIEYNHSSDCYSETPPTMVTSRIDPTPDALLSDTLLGYCNATSVTALNITYNYTWYLNGIANLTGVTPSYTPGIEVNVGNITSSNLSKNQYWILECVANNSGGWSSALNSTATYTPSNVTINISLTRNTTYETEINDAIIYITFNNLTIVNFSYEITYNNTAISSLNVSSSTQINITADFYSPLVSTNHTAFPLTIILNYTANDSGLIFSSQAIKSETVYVNQWYLIEDFTIVKANNITGEQENTIYISQKARPPEAIYDVYYEYSYTMPICTKIYSNNSLFNQSCGVTPDYTTLTTVSLPATHIKENNVMASDIYLNRSYQIFYLYDGEAASTRNITDLQNISREYYVWITNSTNGTLTNMSTTLSKFLTYNFVDETNLSTINIDSAISNYVVSFIDGEEKNFSIDYTNVNTTFIKGYTTLFLWNVSSTEVYSKTGYTTRSRFTLPAEYNFSENNNVTIYLLDNALADAAVIYVTDMGSPVDGAYIQILKYYASTTTYLNIDQKISNNQGEAQFFGDMNAYYKFIISDGSGNIVYTSTDPEQFIYNPSNGWNIVIDIGTQDIPNWITPYATYACYGNNATGTITYTYADAMGLTHTILFYGWDDQTTALVCNQTLSGSSGSYVCTLPADYLNHSYTCAIAHIDGYAWDYFGNPDFRILTLPETDFNIVAIIIICGLGAGGLMVSPVISAGAVTIGIIAMGALGLIDWPTGSVVGLVTIGIVLAYIMTREDDA